MSLSSRLVLGMLTPLGTLVALFYLGVFLFDRPAAFLVAVVGIVLCVAVIAWLLSRTPLWPRADRKRETALWVFCCLMWGAGVSLIIVFWTGAAPMDLALKTGWYDSAFSFGGAWPEEPAKALGVIVIALSLRLLHRPWHVLATGLLVGLGFDVMENALYSQMLAAMDPASDVKGALGSWGLRLLAGPFLHAALTGIVAWGIGLALFVADRSVAWRWRMALSHLGIAFLLHFLWNYTIENETIAIAWWTVLSFIVYPFLGWTVAKAARMAAQDDSYSHGPVRLFPTAKEPTPYQL